ncbi:Uu.00g117700.m01.CDS01 [Anthostomella pinea]|uniref:Uu.00g117700.m01.CDS01 n=1 Tax=Anthostomella pinea TaxID=933095 RepID=A0AAI8VGZ8_9PEZI|nr:Uu.00g117700.m01.CDS01 [Anthostomella pinea]
MSAPNNQAPTKYAVALFSVFQALDVFGPLDILNLLSKSFPLELVILADTLEPVVAQGPAVQWVRQARWVTDGNIWTSSGISAGLDMMYAFIADQHGERVAADLANASEYVRNTDPSVDPFA